MNVFREMKTGCTITIICTRTNTPKYILRSHRLNYGSICDQNGRNFEPYPSRAYRDLLDVMDRASKRLRLDWSRELPKPARGRLDKRFLAGLDRLADPSQVPSISPRSSFRDL